MLTLKHKKIIKYLVIDNVYKKENIYHIFDIDLRCEKYDGSLYETIHFILEGYSIPIYKIQDLDYMNELKEEYDILLQECIEILNNFFKNSIDILE